MTAYLADGIRLDGAPIEIADTLRALGLGRSLAIGSPTAIHTPATASGLSVLDSPAVGDEIDAVMRLLSGEMTQWDERDDFDAIEGEAA